MKIITWKRIKDKGPLKAFFDVQLESGMILRSLKCMAKEDDSGEFFISFPSREYTKRNGRQGWTDFIDFANEDAENRFHDAAMILVMKELASDEATDIAFGSSDTQVQPIIVSDEDIPF